MPVFCTDPSRIRPSLLLEQLLFPWFWSLAPGVDPCETVSEYAARHLYPDLPMDAGVRKFHDLFPDWFQRIVLRDTHLLGALATPADGGVGMAVVLVYNPARPTAERLYWMDPYEAASEPYAAVVVGEDGALTGLGTSLLDNPHYGPRLREMLADSPVLIGPVEPTPPAGAPPYEYQPEPVPPWEDPYDDDEDNGGVPVSPVDPFPYPGEPLPISGVAGCPFVPSKVWQTGTTTFAINQEHTMGAARRKDGTWRSYRIQKPLVIVGRPTKQQIRKLMRHIVRENRAMEEILEAQGYNVLRPQRPRRVVVRKKR